MNVQISLSSPVLIQRARPPKLKDFRFSIVQAALDDAKGNGTAGSAAIEGVGMAPALSELGTSSRLRLTLLLGGKAVVASSDDA